MPEVAKDVLTILVISWIMECFSNVFLKIFEGLMFIKTLLQFSSKFFCKVRMKFRVAYFEKGPKDTYQEEW